MTLEKFREICEAAFKVLQEHKGTLWIADQYESKGVFTSEIQEFIINELADIARDNGLTKVLTVLPKHSGLSAMSAKRWSEEVREKGEFVNEQFKTLADCKEWISETS
ncbi:MAG: hypothetical protein HRT61_24105 [Ekhidna sp.]|nr:hypothetical protein [Ekhidna sp.]